MIRKNNNLNCKSYLLFLIYRKSLELEDRERKLKEREDQLNGKGVSIFYLSLQLELFSYFIRKLISSRESISLI